MKRIAFITTFVLFVFSIAAQNTQKLSAHLSRLVQKQSTVKGKQTDAHSHSILTLMTTNGGTSAKALEREYSGLNVVDSIGRIYIVSIPISNITTLSADNRVERIEAERMPRPAMDVTPGQINATNIYTGTGLPQAFTGRGVAAGVFDCGFDFTHPAFLNSDGNTRAHYYYDFLWPNSDGTLGHALETPDEIAQYGHSQNVNSNIHGTHVMGIMAG